MKVAGSIIVCALCMILTRVYGLPQQSTDDESSFVTLTNHYVDLGVFQNKLQFDVVTVLLLLGEATIWKSIWTRFRFRRSHWKQWIFSISPGWAPLAGSVFAAMQGSRGPPNLIYDRAPAEAIDSKLELTNLNSGATHRATNVILQNVYQAWYQGPRKAQRQPNMKSRYYVSKEIGIVDVDISKMESPTGWTLYVQSLCLLIQLTLALVLGLLGLSLEVFITFLVTLAAQALLLAAITPRADAWDHRELTTHKVSPVLIHMGMDTTSALFVRCAVKDGQTFSLEEYSWESQTVRTPLDVVQLLTAGLSFCGFAFQLIMISWMSTDSRLLFLALGFLGLVANALEGAIEPDWEKTYKLAFTGDGFCEPEGSSLVAALGILIGGKFAGGLAAAKLLYPDNQRFRQTVDNLSKVLEPNICETCCTKLRSKIDDKCLRPGGMLCCTRLANKIDDTEVASMQDTKTIKDALATVSHFLRLGTEAEIQPRIHTDPNTPFEQYNWQKSG